MAETTTDLRELAWLRFPGDALTIDDDIPASRCRSRACQAIVWFGVTKAGKPCPFDIKPNGERTGTSHWRTCQDRGRFRK